MLRSSFRFLCATQALPLSPLCAADADAVTGTVGGPRGAEGHMMPVGIDGQPFTSARVAQALGDASAAAAFKDPMWVTEGQLGLLGVRARAGEPPVVAKKQFAGDSTLRLYNVAQLENPSAIRDMKPQWIDDERVGGLDGFFLSKQQPPAPYGTPDSTRWYTVPDGLKRAGRRALPHAQVASFVMGFGRSRRGFSIVSEGHTEPVSEPLSSSGREAPELLPHVFHTTSNGLLFGNDAQRKLRKLAEMHGYKSNVWHRIAETASTVGNPLFAPNAQSHKLLDKSDAFMNSSYVNGDDYIGDASAAPATAKLQVSGRTGTNFNADTSARLLRIDNEKGFKSDTWITDRYAARCSCAVKSGQEPTSVSMGDRVSLFFNYDQLEGPPGVGAGASLTPAAV